MLTCRATTLTLSAITYVVGRSFGASVSQRRRMQIPLAPDLDIKL